jgi:inosose dehydratase
MAERMEARGLRLAYHHHMGTVIQSEADIDRLIRETGQSVGLLLDTGHLTYAGGDPINVGRRHARRVVHVHCKDVRAAVLERVLRKDAPFLAAVLDGVFTVPGDGAVDFPAVMETLGREAYGGWLVVEAEQDPAKAHPLTYARKGYDCIRALADLGFAPGA